MKKYITILFISTLFSSSVFTQQYTPYAFKNFETEWTHHSFNVDLLDKKINGYFLEDIIFTDDDIYVVYTISSLNWFFNGFLLEKIDINTGILEWQQTYYQESFYLRDSPSRISLRDNNTLVLSTFRQIEEEFQGTDWYASQMNNWVFDTDTGELLNTLTTIDGDPNHVPMVMNINLFLNNLVQSELHEEKDIYKYLLSSYYNFDSDNLSVRILDYNLNELGHATTKDSVFIPLRYPRIYQSYTTRIHENKIFNYRKSFDSNAPQDSFNIEVTHLDSNLNVLHTKNLSNDLFGEDHFLAQINNSGFSVLHLGGPIIENPSYRYTTLYTYDLDGNLLEDIALERPDGSAIYSLDGFNILPIEELNQTLLVSFNRTDSESYWEWFLTTPNGGVEPIGKTIFDNIYDDFAWSFFTTRNRYIKYLGDGKILLHTQHRSAEESNNTTETMIPSLSIISLDKLRTTVSIDAPTLTEELTVYPNPVHSEITIQKGGQYQKYELFNVSGHLVSSGVLQDDKIKVNMLLNGYYILKLYDGGNQVDVQKVVIQRE